MAQGSDVGVAGAGHSSGPLTSALHGLKIVTLGGGTGSYALLSVLKRLPCSVTAIVSVADSGGSPRQLMDELGQLPVGDLRQALVALSTSSLLWRDLFNFRFDSLRTLSSRTSGFLPTAAPAPAPAADKPRTTGGVSGHNLGNLILSALQELHGDDLLLALGAAKRLLRVVGDVVPVTLLHATLSAELADGAVLHGETEIADRGAHDDSTRALPPIRNVRLEPPVPACPRALDAIRCADLIVIGPGDLYTSILPTLLVEGVSKAIVLSHARKVYVCNLTTTRGVTDGFRAVDFVREIQRYLGGDRYSIDRVILHNGLFPDHLRQLYRSQGQEPVEVDDAQLALVTPLVRDVLVDDLLATHADHFARHDAAKLVRAIARPITT